jgi:hypothetical protein
LAPPPAVRQNRAEQRAETRAQNGAPRPIQNPGHLAQWMESHKSLSLADQQRALQNEPGFRDLPRETQQQQLNELGRLYSMNPEQRGRMLDRTEALERLTPAQRQQYNGAARQLYALPQPRRMLIGRAMLDLRMMPPAEREQVIDSPRFASQFSPDERSMVRTLLTAEPYPGAQTP